MLTLAGKVFKDLQEEYTSQESILRFFMGAKEREAGEPEVVPAVEYVNIKTAERGLQMNGSIVGQVAIQLGDSFFKRRFM